MVNFLNNEVSTFKVPRGGVFTKLGVRIALTEIVLFLKEIFNDYCDGYIAPKMLSHLYNLIIILMKNLFYLILQN